MENWNNELTDQADELRKLVNDVEGEDEQPVSPEPQNHQKLERETKEQSPLENDQTEAVDILNLPPRRDVHRQSQQHIKLKISRASRRLMAVIIILLLVFGTAFYVWGEDLWTSIVNM